MATEQSDGVDNHEDSAMELSALVRDRIDGDGNLMPPGPRLEDWPESVEGEPDASE